MLAGVFSWLLRRRQAACRRCPHGRLAHVSYSRPGWCTTETEAGTCPCYQYKPERPWALALAYLRERPAPVTADVLRPRPVQFPVPDPVGYDDKTEFGLRVPPWVFLPRDGRQEADR